MLFSHRTLTTLNQEDLTQSSMKKQHAEYYESDGESYRLTEHKEYLIFY